MEREEAKKMAQSRDCHCIKGKDRDTNYNVCIDKIFDWHEGKVKEDIIERGLQSRPRQPKKRYFIVFYRLFRVGGGFNYWYANVDTEGEYLNYNEITVKIKDRLNNDIEKDSHKIESILITNIIELNESDYKDWVK